MEQNNLPSVIIVNLVDNDEDDNEHNENNHKEEAPEEKTQFLFLYVVCHVPLFQSIHKLTPIILSIV